MQPYVCTPRDPSPRLPGALPDKACMGSCSHTESESGTGKAIFLPSAAPARGGEKYPAKHDDHRGAADQRPSAARASYPNLSHLSRDGKCSYSCQRSTAASTILSRATACCSSCSPPARSQWAPWPPGDSSSALVRVVPLRCLCSAVCCSARRWICPTSAQTQLPVSVRGPLSSCLSLSPASLVLSLPSSFSAA